MHLSRSISDAVRGTYVFLLSLSLFLGVMVSPAKAAENPSEKGRKAILITYIDTLLHADSVFALGDWESLDSILHAGGESLSDSVLFVLMDRTGKNALMKGRHVPAIEMYEEALAYFGRSSEPRRTFYVVSIQIVLGASYEEVGLWARAMDLYISVLEESEKGKRKETGSALNNIGNIYFKQGYYDKAKYYWDSAIAVNTRQGNKNDLVNNYNNLSGLYYVQQDYPKTLAALSQALAQIDQEKNPDLYYLIWTNMATVYNRQGRKTVALEMIRQVIDFQQQNHHDMGLISSYLLLGDIYGESCSDSAGYYLSKALDLSHTIKNKAAEISVLQALYRLYRSQDKYKDALLTLERTNLLQDSLDVMDNRLKLENMEAAYEIERQQQVKDLHLKAMEIEYLQAQRQNIILISVLLGLLLLAVVLLYRYNVQKKMRKQDRELSLKQQELYEREKEMMRIREQELKDSLELRNRELTSKVLHLVKNNEFIIDINRELQQLLLELNPKDKVKKEHIREMLLKLRDQSNEGTYAEFKYYFEQVHQSFYENLQKAYPILTYKDLRLCSFLRLGLSSKEIAAITFKEVRSVESARNRLRKKMELDAEVNLIEFFSQF